MKKFLLVIALIAFISGCDESQIEGNKGELALRLQSEGVFKSANSVDVDEFMVKIENEHQIVQSWNKYSEVPSVIILEPGNYSISATSPGEMDAAWDQPIYDGIEPFVVEPGQVTNIDLICFLSNMKVTVVCTDEFLKEIQENFSITVSSATSMLNYDKEVVLEGRAGYFKVSPLQVHISGVRVSTGLPINELIEITNVAAQDHHKLTIGAVETGHVTMGANGLTLDYTLNDREEDIFIPGFEEEEVPGPEPDPEPDPEPGPDPDPSPDPEPGPDPVPNPITIVAPGITESLILTTEQAGSADVTVTLSTESAISELWVNIQSAILEPLLVDIGFPANFDMANPDESLTASLTELGLLANGEVKGQRSYSFSLGLFMGLIPGSNDPVTQKHQFTVKVKDTEGNEKTETLTIIRLP